MRDAWGLADATASGAGVRIVRLQALRDADAVNVVIDRIWGAQALGHELLRALQHAGCVFLGARDLAAGDGDGDWHDPSRSLAGFVLGFVGVDRGLHVHSHMLAVMPEWQGRGVGLALKLGQRAWTQDAGIAEVRWTYDPMLLSNARFNLLKLGAVAARFEPNFYGAMGDELNRGERTDRFEVSWSASSERVTRTLRAGGAPPIVAPEDAVVVLAAEGDPSAPRPVVTRGAPGDRALVAVPRDHLRLRREDPALAAAWRDAAAEAFAGCFDRGLVATTVTGDGRYLFERVSP
jgi:predicted GNAT superfamily acetyltransferase